MGLEELDLHISNARLRRGGEKLVDIAIAGGRIVAIGEGVGGGGAGRSMPGRSGHRIIRQPPPASVQGVDAADDGRGGARRLPWRGHGQGARRIDLASAIKAKYDAAWIIPNARRAVALAALYGVLHIRAFADVDRRARLEGVKALIAVREEFRGIVDIQVCAFAQDGIVREPGAAADG